MKFFTEEYGTVKNVYEALQDIWGFRTKRDTDPTLKGYSEQQMTDRIAQEAERIHRKEAKAQRQNNGGMVYYPSTIVFSPGDCFHSFYGQENHEIGFMPDFIQSQNHLMNILVANCALAVRAVAMNANSTATPIDQVAAFLKLSPDGETVTAYRFGRIDAGKQMLQQGYDAIAFPLLFEGSELFSCISKAELSKRLQGTDAAFLPDYFPFQNIQAIGRRHCLLSYNRKENDTEDNFPDKLQALLDWDALCLQASMTTRNFLEDSYWKMRSPFRPRTPDGRHMITMGSSDLIDFMDEHSGKCLEEFLMAGPNRFFTQPLEQFHVIGGKPGN